MVVFLSLINLFICLFFFIRHVKAGRYLAFFSFLLVYFSIFCIPLSLESRLRWFRGFTGDYQELGSDVILYSIFYISVFNLIYFICELFFMRIFLEDKNKPKTASSYQGVAVNKRLILILFGYWFFGALLFFVKMGGAGYRDYVEGSGWPQVFFIAATPLIAIFSFRRRYVLASILCLPYIIMAYHLGVRSFVLISALVVIFIYFKNIANSGVASFGYLVRRALLIGLILVIPFSYIIMKNKNNSDVIFPDSVMPYGVPEVIYSADKNHVFVGWDGFILYVWNFVNPFAKLFGIQKPNILDTPVIIAQLLEGVPSGWDVYFHYPALIWSDVYISFGEAGVLMAALWAFILVGFEYFMNRFPRMVPLILPFFIWHNYMLVRGATAIASVPFAYSFYFSFFAFYFSYAKNLFVKRTIV